MKKEEAEKEKGFSLVEVLAAVLILSFILFAVCVFLMTSTNLYKENSREVDLQQEAQTTLNQLYDLILPMNDLKVCHLNRGLDTEMAVIFGHAMDESNTKKNYIILYRKEKQKIYLLKKAEEYTFGGTESDFNALCGEVTEEANLLAQYVTDCVIDDSELAVKQILTVTMQFTIRDDSYEIMKQMKLRNKQI
ncbi:PilW family protein [Anaerosporobacter faecicola]|uniref:PilW family protein n=1 Tax=Anaerosporobacter faecicola TaxID=2718714 RepID=UPI001EE55CBC|nr:prepilin-type N-terminal cleavage/methylation domain-containing protein [Anaerosporobacter faecicola]